MVKLVICLISCMMSFVANAQFHEDQICHHNGFSIKIISACVIDKSNDVGIEVIRKPQIYGSNELLESINFCLVNNQVPLSRHGLIFLYEGWDAIRFPITSIVLEKDGNYHPIEQDKLVKANECQLL